jgi:hypothetical protein
MEILNPPPEGVEYQTMKVLFHDEGTYWQECYVWVVDHKVKCRPTGRSITSMKGWEEDLRTKERSRRPKKKIVR